MLTVVMRSGSIREYMPDQYTDYMWNEKAFIVIKGNQWIGMFNWDCVKEVFFAEIKEDK